MGNKGPKYRGISRDNRGIVYSDQTGLAEFFRRVEEGSIKDYTVEEIKKAYENNFNLYKKIDELDRRIEDLESARNNNSICPNCSSESMQKVEDESLADSIHCKECGLVMGFKP